MRWYLQKMPDMSFARTVVLLLRSLLKSLISLDLIVFPCAPEIHCGFSLNYWGTNFRLYRITKVFIFIISCSSMCRVDLITTGSIFILVIPEKSWREIKINCGYCTSLTPSSAQNIRLTNDFFFYTVFPNFNAHGRKSR